MAMGLDIKSNILYTSTEALIFTSDKFSFYRCTKFYAKLVVYCQPNFVLCYALVKAVHIQCGALLTNTIASYGLCEIQKSVALNICT